MDEKTVTHYICQGGCGGVAPAAGSCQTSTCPHFGQPLQGCGCTDGGHKSEPSIGSTPAGRTVDDDRRVSS